MFFPSSRVRAALLLLSIAPTSSWAKPPTSPNPILRSSAACAAANAAEQSWWLTLRGGAAPPCPSPSPLPLQEWHPVLLAFLGTSFGWLMTALGSAAVVIHRLGLPETAYRKVLDFMLGVSGGVMTAASYWSLLAPALEFAELQGCASRRARSNALRASRAPSASGAEWQSGGGERVHVAFLTCARRLAVACAVRAQGPSTATCPSPSGSSRAARCCSSPTGGSRACRARSRSSTFTATSRAAARPVARALRAAGA